MHDGSFQWISVGSNGQPCSPACWSSTSWARSQELRWFVPLRSRPLPDSQRAFAFPVKVKVKVKVDKIIAWACHVPLTFPISSALNTATASPVHSAAHLGGPAIRQDKVVYDIGHARFSSVRGEWSLERLLGWHRLQVASNTLIHADGADEGATCNRTRN